MNMNENKTSSNQITQYINKAFGYVNDFKDTLKESVKEGIEFITEDEKTLRTLALYSSGSESAWDNFNQGINDEKRKDLIIEDITETYPEYKALTEADLKDIDRIYKNRFFKHMFGEETWNKSVELDPEIRDAKVKQAIGKSDFNRFFYDKEVPEEIQALSQNLTGEAFEYLIDHYNDDYYDDNKRRKLKEKDEENYEQYLTQASSRGMFVPAGYDPITKQTEYLNKNRDFINKVKEVNVNTITNSEIYKNIKQEYRDNLTVFSLQSPDEFDNLFNSVINAKNDDGTYIFNYYHAAKEEGLKGDTLIDKLEVLSEYYSASEASKIFLGKDKNNAELENTITSFAVEAINAHYQSYLHENQDHTLWDSFLTGLNGLVIGIGSLPSNLYALTLSGEERQEFMNSGAYKYWHDADKYGTLDKDKHAVYDALGGVSLDKYIKDVGEEFSYDPESMLYEVTEMTGYALGSIGVDVITLGLGKLGGLAVKGTGALTKSLIGAKNLERASKLGTPLQFARIKNGINKLTDVGEDVVRLTLHSANEASLEANEAYNTVYQNTLEVSNEAIFNTYLEEYLDIAAQNKAKDLYQKELNSNNSASEGQLNELPDNRSIREQHLYNESFSNINTEDPRYQEILKEVRDNIFKNKDYYTSQLFDDEELKYLTNKANEEAKTYALKAADKAYNTEYWTKTAANALIDGTFHNYLFAKPLNMGKNKLSKDLLNPDLTVKDKKQLNKVFWGRMAKNSVTEGLQEMSDESLREAAINVGYQEATSYLHNIGASIEDTAALGNFSSSFDAWNTGAVEGFFTESALYQGAIAALTPFAAFNINPKGVINVFKKDVALKDKLLGFLYNPLIQGRIQLSDEVKALEDLHLAELDEAAVDNFKTILNFINTEEKETNNRVFNDFNTAYRLASNIAVEAPVLGEVSERFNTYLDIIDRLSKGQITDEEINAYTSKNTQTAEITNEMRESARQAIQSRAADLVEIMNNYVTMSNSVRNMEVSDITKNEIIYNGVMAEYMKKKAVTLEQAITGSKHISSSDKDGARTVKGIDSEIKSLDSDIKYLEDLRTKISKKQEKDDKDKKSNEAKTLSKYGHKRVIYRINDLIDQLNLRKNKLTKDSERIKTAIGNGYNIQTVLTKDEILKLSPSARAAFIRNKDAYTIAQQEEIEKIDEETIENILLSEDINTFLEENKNFSNIFTDKRHAQLLDQYINDSYRKNINVQQALSVFLPSLRSTRLSIIKKEMLDSFRGIRSFDLENKIKRNGALTADDINALLSDPEILLNSDEKTISVLINTRNKLTSNHMLHKAIFDTLEKKGINRAEAQAMINKLIEFSINSDTQEDLEKKIKNEYGEDHPVIMGYKDIKKLFEAPKDNAVDSKSKSKEDNTKTEVTQDNSNNSNKGEESEVEETKKDTVIEESKPKENENTGVSKDTETFDSPSLQESNKDLDKGKNVVEVQNDSLISEDEITQKVSDSDEGILLGNVSSAYNPNDLTVTEESPVKRLSPRITQNKKDSYTAFIQWAKDNGLEYQKIVDNILGKINDKYHPKVYYMRPLSSGDENADNTVALIIELTDEIRNDKTITIPGNTLRAWDTVSNSEKEYIVIGQAGYSKDPTNFNNAKNNAPFSKTSDGNSIYYVNSNNYTRVKSITSGVIANARENDEKVFKSIGDLLKDPNSPNALKFSDLVFGFMTNDGMTLIGDTSKVRGHQFYHPATADMGIYGIGSGNVFVYIPAANGNYIPIYLPFRRLGETKKDSKLYANIELLAEKLLNGDLETKREITTELSRLLYTSKDSNQYIGVTNEGNFYIKNSRYGSIEGKDNPTKEKVMRALESFYLNFNSIAFQENFKLLDDAGAFSVDIISLSTYNAQFTVYNTKEEADNFDKIPENNTEPEQKIEGKVKNNTYIEVGGTRYSKVGDSWVYTDSGKKVTNTSFTDVLDAYTKAVARGVTATLGNKVVYVTEDGKYIYQDTDGKIVTMSFEDTAEEEIDSRRDKAAAEELQVQETVETSLEESQPEVPNTPEEIREHLNEVFGEQQEESKEIIEEEPKKVDNNLDNSEIITNFAKELDSREEVLDKLGELLEEKGLVSGDFNANDVAKTLVNMGISIENLDFIDTIKDIIKNCR
jgi:hypothetical protein